ncbi:hypothetical protein AgCh_035411 [Apium graveolens]
MPAHKAKGEIKARLLRSSTQTVQATNKGKSEEVDIRMGRLIKAAEGPSLSREFDKFFKALRASLNNNFFTYKKALDMTINSKRGDSKYHEGIIRNSKRLAFNQGKNQKVEDQGFKGYKIGLMLNKA